MKKIYRNSKDVGRQIKTSVAGTICKVFPGLIGLRKPPILVVEASNRCTLQCPICDTVNAMKRTKGLMSREVFSRLLAQTKGFVKKMQFSFAGEPLMNPQLAEMIALATREGILCKVDTNGMLLEKYAEGLVDAGLDRLNVALNGIDQAMLTTYRKNADFDKIVHGVKKTIAYRDKKGKKFPKVHMQYLVTKYNEDSLKEAKTLARAIGFDAIEFKSLSVCLGDWISEEARQKLADEFLPRDKRFLRYEKKHNTWVFKKALNRFCADIFSSAVVLWNGDVILCCMDFEGRCVLGNIVQQDFLTLWRGARARQYRKSILARTLPLCGRCALTVGHIERHLL